MSAAINVLLLRYSVLIMAALPDAAAVLRLSVKMGRGLRRNLRESAKIQAHAARERLSQDAGFRAEILSDLGGACAMAAWHNRRHKAKVSAAFRVANGLPAATFPNQSPAAKSTARAVYQPKTDRYGLFRLAVIQKGARGDLPETAAKPRRKYQTVTRIWRAPLIEIHPDDLGARPPLVPRDRYEKRSVFTVSTDRKPPIFRPPI
ncbi:hypothetical protein AB8615_03620 [Litorimonas sp. RW-G-Af-16]|uniref:hypothetical protein n=1 Tax=Litorimonas sp. RW-G-Af-16 TaxID=3241168 RepID=UPI003AAD1D70